MLDLSDVQYDSAQFSDAIFAGMGTDLTAEDVRPRMRDGAPKLAPSGEPTYATGVVGPSRWADLTLAPRSRSSSEATISTVTSIGWMAACGSLSTPLTSFGVSR